MESNSWLNAPPAFIPCLLVSPSSIFKSYGSHPGLRIDKNADSGWNNVMSTCFNNRAAAMPCTGVEMMAAPSSHPCSSQKYVGSVVSADCKDGEIFRLEEPQFPKWEIFCFLSYRTSWRVGEADEARACHKGEP